MLPQEKGGSWQATGKVTATISGDQRSRDGNEAVGDRVEGNEFISFLTLFLRRIVASQLANRPPSISPASRCGADAVTPDPYSLWRPCPAVASCRHRWTRLRVAPPPPYTRRSTTVATAPAAPSSTSDTTASTKAAFIVLVFIVPSAMNPKYRLSSSP